MIIAGTGFGMLRGPRPGAYGGRQILIQAIRRVGLLDRVKLRDAISKMDQNTAFGRFRSIGTGSRSGTRCC